MEWRPTWERSEIPNAFLAKTEGGSYVIASNKSPRFCFEGATPEEATDTARRALAFYERAKAKLPAPPAAE